MSPEQAMADEKIDTRSDLYSLGATLYNMLTAKTPFPGKNDVEIINQHLSGPIPDPRRIVPTTSEPTSQIVRRLLAKKPRLRYQKPQDLVRDIDRVFAGQPISRPPEISGSRRRRGASSASRSGSHRPTGSRSLLLPIAGASLLAVVLIALMIWAVMGSGSSSPATGENPAVKNTGPEQNASLPLPPVDPNVQALDAIRSRPMNNLDAIRRALTDLRRLQAKLTGRPLVRQALTLEANLRIRLREAELVRGDAVLERAETLAEQKRYAEAIEALEGAVLEVSDPEIIGRFNRRIIEFRRLASPGNR